MRRLPMFCPTAQAEARAQSERLYNSPAAVPSTRAAVGAGLRRAMSAMPRNRHLRVRGAWGRCRVGNGAC